MAGFESGVESGDRSRNCDTTTAPIKVISIVQNSKLYFHKTINI